jgi:ABC-type glycerol-3-phosphate transport system permease component
MIRHQARKLEPSPVLQRRKPRLARAMLYGLLVLLTIFFGVPFVFMVTGSFKTNAEVFSLPISLWVNNPTLENFRRLLTGEVIPYVRMFWNSTVIGVAETLLTVLVSTLVGWGFAKYQFPGKNLLFLLLVATLALPFQVIIVPLFQMMIQFRWLDTFWALIVPGAVSAFGAFFMRQAMLSIPNELLDAGRIDGANEWHLFWHIGLPLSRGAIAVLSVITFLRSWNELLWPAVALRSPENFTLPLGIQALDGYTQVEYGMIVAGSLLSVLPIIVIFVIGGKNLLDNLTTGSVKG